MAVAAQSEENIRTVYSIYSESYLGVIFKQIWSLNKSHLSYRFLLWEQK